MNNSFQEIAATWTTAPFDAETQEQAKELIAKGGPELEDSFYKNMEFGTGGMRGIMGVGTNRINKYTLGAATQGLSNYLNQTFADLPQISVAIGYDCRHNSDTFAQLVADVFTANGIKVYLFESLRPTPELSFAIRHLGCQSGIVLTASHNPREYNGYKAYWNDGAQIVAPHDTAIINNVQNTAIEDIKFEGNPALLEMLGAEMDQTFIDAVCQQSLSNAGKEDLNIVFTSIHGTSIKGMPQALAQAGFKNVQIVEEQATPDGNFPTVISPNPEEAEALSMAIAQADRTNADIVVGTDPDADRIGIAVRNNEGKMVIVNGNQTAAMLTWFLLDQWKKQGKLKGKEFVCETIVTSNVIQDIAKAYNVDCEITLTGFKWIASKIREHEGTKTFIGGGEESFGYMIGDFVRDKDSISSAMIACEIAATAKANGSSFYKEMVKMYQQFGLYHEELVAIVKKGKEGADLIKNMMSNMRANPPASLGGIKVVAMDDVQTGEAKDLVSNTTSKLNLPSSNVLQFYLENGGKVTARPSGTEPKIKFYFSVKDTLDNANDYDKKIAELAKVVAAIKNDLDL